jgi:hypothetical protein
VTAAPAPALAPALGAQPGAAPAARLCRWERREEIAARIPASRREATVRAADEALRRRFRFRGVEVSFEGRPIDWTCRPGGNTDWSWDLNRHHFFVTLGRAYWYTADERYAGGLCDLIDEWMRANPPGTRAPAWTSVFEVGVRVASWSWAHALLLPSVRFGAEARRGLLAGLLGTGRFLRANLERHAWNNHLLLEAKALAMLGVLYPELPGARAWAEEGLRVLGAQLARQVTRDGVHSERSSFYHQLVASELLELAVVLRLLGRRDAALEGSLRLLAGFLEAITRADGTIPMLGDASRHDEHVRFDPLTGIAALLDEPALAGGARDERGDLAEGTVWLLAGLEEARRSNSSGSGGGGGGSEARAGAGGSHASPGRARAEAAPASRAFPQGGYWVLRSGEGDDALHLVFDCGPFGDPVVPGHGHADALSIDVQVGRHHALVDPGMYSAHLGEKWRNFFRGTLAHNTVVVDGRDQSLLRGLRRVYREAPARLLEWLSTPAFDLARGEHLGYRRLPAPVTHRRSVFFLKPRFWLLLDRLEGSGAHPAELLFHLAPGAAPEVDPAGGVAARGADGRGLAILPVGRHAPEVIAGRAEPPQGWVAYVSGVKEPAPVVSYRREGPLPLSFATLLVPLLGGAPGRPRVERLDVARAAGGAEAPETEAVDGAVGGAVLFADGRRGLFLAALDAPAAPGVRRRAGGLASDGRLAAVALDARGEVEAAVVVGGGYLAWEESVLLERERALESWSFTSPR